MERGGKIVQRGIHQARVVRHALEHDLNGERETLTVQESTHYTSGTQQASKTSKVSHIKGGVRG